MNTVTFNVVLEQVTCRTCGMIYALSEGFIDGARSDPSVRWRCPSMTCSSSTWGFSDSKEDKLRRQLDSARRDAEQARAHRDRVGRKLAAQKGVTTKLKKRIAHGLCPCCRRTFENLQDHMAHLHPEYTDA